MNKVLALLTLMLLASGCATTSKSIDVANTSVDEGVVLGKIKIVYNGSDLTDACAISFNERESNLFALETDGLIIQKLPKGRSTIREIFCVKFGYREARYIFSNPPTFENLGNGKITYIGDMRIDWKTADEIKVGRMFGLIGYAATKDDVDGLLEYQVEDNFSGTKSLYEQLKQPAAEPEYTNSIISPRSYKTEKCQVNCPD